MSIPTFDPASDAEAALRKDDEEAVRGAVVAASSSVATLRPVDEEDEEDEVLNSMRTVCNTHMYVNIAGGRGARTRGKRERL
jgi:hypothetical protein